MCGWVYFIILPFPWWCFVLIHELCKVLLFPIVLVERLCVISSTRPWQTPHICVLLWAVVLFTWANYEGLNIWSHQHCCPDFWYLVVVFLDRPEQCLQQPALTGRVTTVQCSHWQCSVTAQPSHTESVSQQSERNNMKLPALLVIISLLSQVYSSPVRFMCDMCEGDWVSCIMQCSLEQYITRDQFDRWHYTVEGEGGKLSAVNDFINT